MTQASDALVSWGNECSSAGKATFTIERSREAMKAPRAVTTNTSVRRLLVMPASVATGSTMGSPDSGRVSVALAMRITLGY